MVPSRAAALALAALFCVCMAISWQRWGHVRIDCGGALDRAARLAQGETLYRDVQSPYGPLADYVLAAGFRAFGIHVAVAQALGTTILLVQSALLWLVARRLLGELGCIAALAVFWLYMAFLPGLGGWILPNTFSMTFGATFATGTLVAMIAYGTRATEAKLLVAGLCAACACLSKIEFGAAAACTLAVAAICTPTSARARVRMLGVGLVPAAIVVGVVVLVFSTLVGWDTLIADNLFRVRSLGNSVARFQTFAEQAAPRWPALLGGFLGDVVGLPLRALLLAWAAHLVRGLWPARGGAAACALAALWLTVLPAFRTGSEAYFYPILPVLMTSGSVPWRDWTAFMALPELSAPILISPLVAIVAWVCVRRTAGQSGRSVAVIATFAALLIVRWQFRVVLPSYYGFVAPIFILLGARAIVRAAVGSVADIAVPVALLASLVLPLRFLAGAYATLDYPLEYPRGRIVTNASEGAPLAATVDYIRAHTTPTDPVVVLPEERLINFLAERRNPTPDSGIGPGWLATDADVDSYLRRLEAAQPRLVVVSARTYPEFGGAGGFESYAPRVMAWIQARYRPVVRGWYTIFERTDVVEPGDQTS